MQKYSDAVVVSRTFMASALLSSTYCTVYMHIPKSNAGRHVRKSIRLLAVDCNT